MDETRSVYSFPVDLNSASRIELEATGLPAELVQAVLEYRAAHGPFGSVKDLLEVPGFDSAALDTLGARVIVNLERPGADIEVPAVVSDESEVLQQTGLDVGETSSDAAAEVAVDGTDGPGEPDLAPGAEEAEPAEPVLEPASAGGDAVNVPEAASDGDELAYGVDDGSVEPLPAAEGAIERTSTPETVASVVQWQGAEAISEQGDRDSDAVSAAASDVPIARADLAVEGLAVDEAEKDTSPPLAREDVPDPASLQPGHNDAVLADDDAHQEATPDRGGAADVAASPAEKGVPGRQSEASATPPVAPRERSRWHDVGMIALGGLLGVLATLVILGVVGGTLNYAPRRLVDAMNENLAVMQANQEMTWSETQALIARADALDRRLSALEGLDDRVAALESGSAEIETRLADTAASLAQLDAELAELAESQAAMFEEMDGRISGQEREISTLNDTVTSAQQTLQGIQDQVARYEAFFEALRSLLDDMQESAAAETGA